MPKLLTCLSLSFLLGPVCSGAVFTYEVAFDGSYDTTVSAPYQGLGTLTYEAAAPLLDDSYDYLSFTALTLDFSVGGFFFDEEDLTTTASEVNIVLNGWGFYFTNDTPGGGIGDGGGGGSADFFTGTQMLNFIAYEDGAAGPSYLGGGATTPTYSILDYASGATLGSGTYGTPEGGPISTPEPGTGVLWGLTAALFFVRRRR